MRNKPTLPVPEYLLENARQIFKECDLPEKARAQTTVTLRRRFRGTNKSDLLGCFSSEVGGPWLGDGPEKQHLMDMHSFQIVKPIIRANQAAMVQARVQCTIVPTSKNPGLMGVASIAKGIYKYFDNHPDYWSNNLENQVNQQCQTDPGYFIHTYHDPDAESAINITLDEYSDEPLEDPGKYACPYCGSSGPLFQEQMGNAVDGTIPCLNDDCDQNAEIEIAPSMSDSPQFKGKSEHPAGNIVQDVISAFQIRVDERKSKNGNLRKAEWLEHHFLMEEDDLQALVPFYNLGPPSEWSYPLKWEYSLESGTDLYLKPWSADYFSGQRPRHEVRRIYMRPAKYRHYRAPQDFTLDRGDGRAALNRQGQPMLQIKRGESLVKYFPKGFWYIVSSDQLLPITEPCDFRDEWGYGGFLNDSASFWSQQATELNELQRTANNLWTIDVQHRESGSIVTTVYDREFFDADDFERQLSPTKEGVHIENGDTIQSHYAEVSPPQMTGAMQGIEFIRSIVGDISGVQPAAIGAQSPNEPYAAQRLQKQQSLGLLTPSQQSKAECKSIVFLQHLKCAQKTKPLEWFQYIGTMYGEEWKEQDIEAFLNSNLEMDLRVSYKEGSEVPASLIEQELKYRQFVLDMAQAAGLTKNPALLTPEMLSKYAEMAGIDYDVENIEADQRLADSRYQKFKDWLEANQDTGLPEEVLVQLAIADKSMKVFPFENHDTHKEFYGDHARALMAAPEPNYPLISCCVEMIKRHEAGGVDAAQTESASQVEGHAPEMAVQVAAAQAQAKQEAATQEAELQAEQQKLQTQIEMKAMELQAKSEENDKDRELDAAMKAEELRVKMAEVNMPEAAEPAAVPIDPFEEVLGSATYKDVPPAAQSSLLRKLGLPSGGTQAVHPAVIAKQKAAMQSRNKAKASSSK